MKSGFYQISIFFMLVSIFTAMFYPVFCPVFCPVFYPVFYPEIIIKLQPSEFQDLIILNRNIFRRTIILFGDWHGWCDW